MTRRRATRGLSGRRAVFAAVVVVLLVVLGAALFAGSETRLASGTTIGGIDVGGLERSAATALLTRRSDALEQAPLMFVAAGKEFQFTASQLGVRSAWAAAVAEAARATDGIGPVRGVRRLRSHLFGVNVQPTTSAYPSAVRVAVGRIARAVDRPAVQARLRRNGLAAAVVPERAGVRLDRAAASAAIVAGLAALEREDAVALPIARVAPTTTSAELADAQRAFRVATSAPVTLDVAGRREIVSPDRIARLVQLPAGGATKLGFSGRAADRWLAGLANDVARPPADATFGVVSGGIHVVPARPGRKLDVDASRRAFERAILSETGRRATFAVDTAQPERTTAEARAMGIDGVVGSYTTTYGGTPGRLHNVQLVADLIDGALVAPGTRFSFNQTTGERNEAKGFEEAPVIINGELQNGIGGGVCQVSTTLFNAVFEAGLSIESRTNHALYISHYPLGRDATVNFPDIDLVFRNDTDKWLLVRTFVGAGSLTVNVYGTPQNRRVETETAPLEVEGKVPWKRIDDRTMFKGEKVVEQFGAPPRSTSVTRRVYASDGTLMYDTTWSSYYVGEPTVVRLGTKPRPKPEKPVEPGPAAKGKAAGGDGPTVTVPPTTTPTG
ncbi:MAG TPA: VanW family protein [Gaiella sp.]|nr:VanW family protein [Gaiella sp.]